MIRVVASNSPIDAAWAAFDAAAIELNRMYRFPRASEANERRVKAQEVLRLWDAWRALFLGDEPRPAA